MKNYMISNGQALYGDRFVSILDDMLRDQAFVRRPAFLSTFALDVRSDESSYIVEANLPGVNKEDVKIELLDSRMTISVDKKEESTEKKEGYLRRERSEIASRRTILLPESDAEGIEAKLTDGVLTVNVPKVKKEDLTRHIEVQ